MKPTTFFLFTMMKFAQRAVLMVAGRQRLMRLLMPVLLAGIFITAGAQPVITSFSPAVGYAGSTVTITGSGFDITKTNNIVFFGPAQATVTGATATSLQVTVPIGVAFGNISVLNATTGLMGYSHTYFMSSYDNSPYETDKINFDSRIDSATGAFPNSSRMADFDGDGKMDVVGSNFNNGSIYIYRNTGSAGIISFAGRITIATGSGAFRLNVGDLDGDGKIDIAVPNRGANTVTLLRNTSTPGSISFATGVSVSVAGGPSSTVLDDIDGDGKTDLVVGRQNDLRISVYRNVGTVGTFSLTAATELTVPNQPMTIFTSDIDGDGQPDIAAGGYATPSEVSIFRNKSTPGNVVIAARQGYSSTGRTSHISFPDLDGDGKHDMIVSELDNGRVAIYRSTSDIDTISFDTGTPLTTGGGAADVDIADFNGDGKADVAVANSSGLTMSILVNNSTAGAISFADKIDFAVPHGAFGTSTGDLDGDGKPDIAVSCQSSNKISFFRNSPLNGIGGPAIVCTGQPSSFSNTGSGGAWSSSNTAVATVNSSTGVVTGVTAGTATITYTGTAGASFAGNRITKAITVNTSPVVTFTAQPGALAKIASNVTYTTQAGMSSYVWGIPGVAGTDYAIVSGGTSPDNSTVLMWLTSGTKTVTINYTNADGCAAATAASSTATAIQLPPTITSFTPSVSIPGSTAVITGTNFNTTAANNMVYFGPVKAVVNAATATSLDVTVPVSAMHNGISVFNTGTAMWGRSAADYAPTFNNTGMFSAWPNFDAQVTFTTGTMPLGLAAGDLDGDGKPEIITGNVGSGAISVLRNNAVSGTISASSFNSLMTKSTAGATFAISIADLDGDGKPDIVGSCTNATKVSIFRNSTAAPGSVTLDNVVNVEVGTNSTGVATGDIDGDGMIDIIASGNGSRKVVVLRNTSVPSSLSFDASKSFTVTAAPYDIAIADVDGDGRQDVIAGSNDSSYFSVFRNVSSAGTIAFDAGSDIRLSSKSLRMKAGDVDGDGRMDVLITMTNDTAAVFRNTSSTGAVSFDAEVSVAIADRPDFIGLGDINGDQKPDLAVTQLDGGQVSVLVNNSVPGTIGFAPAMPLTTGSEPSGVIICDADGDGRMDILVANQSNSNVTVLRNHPLSLPPVIASVSPLSGNTDASINITGANFNPTPGNNTVYFGATSATVTAAGANSLTVKVPAQATARPVSVRNSDLGLSAVSKPFLPGYDNSADVPGVIRLDPNATVAGGTTPAEIALADMDGDGKADIVNTSTGNARVGVSLNAASAGSLTATSFPARTVFTTGAQPRGLAVGDIDGDGKQDIVTCNAAVNTISVLRNTTSSVGAVSMAAKVDVATGTSPQYVAIGDVDGDGRPDVAVANVTGGSVSIYHNRSQPGMILLDLKMDISVTNPRGLVLTDLNGDGMADLAVARGTGNSIVVYTNTFNSGSALFNSGFTYNTGTSTAPRSILANDIDGDGLTDLVVTNSGAANVMAFRNTSSGGVVGFAGAVAVTAGTTPQFLSAADIDGDGRADLAVSNTGSATVSVLRNTSSVGSISFAAKIDSVTGTNPAGVAAGDMDGDGRPDLAICNNGTTTITLYRTAQMGLIFGAAPVCVGATITLSDGTNGGVWTSSNTSIATVTAAGVVTGVGAGTAVITYAVGVVATTASVTVNPLADPGTISGVSSVCEGATRMLSSNVAGGVWSSANTALATVNGAGVVMGISAGSVAISYTATNGCGSVSAQGTMTVMATPPSITGVNIMAPFHSDTLSNAGGPGTWSSSAPIIATIHATTGIVAALSPGTTVIRFTNTNGCSADTSLVVSAGNTVCVGQTIVLSNGGIPGGTWGSGSGSIARVNGSTGVVTGVAAGRVIMYYVLPSGAFLTQTVTVNALSQILGATSVCQTFTSTVANATPGGGYWSCVDPQATINSAGVISGVSSGVVTIYFTTTQGCVATRTITVYPTAPITGVANTVCVSQAIVLTNSLAGGSWSTSSNALATVSNVGVVKGIAQGVPRVSYIWPNGCHMTYSVTVNALSQISGGTTGMCQGGSMTLANTTPYGGVWSSSNSAAATISASGVVRGAAPGVTTISFTSNASGCVATKTVTVNACRERDTTSDATTAVEAVAGQTFDLKLFPNPNTGSFVLKGIPATADGELAVEIVNMTGQVIYRGKAQVQNGSVNARIDLDGQLPAGMYVLNAIGERERRTFHFILQR